MTLKAISLSILTVGICASSQAATITLVNANFDAGSGTNATGWTQVQGAGSNPSGPSNYWLSPYVTGAGGSMFLKSDGGNYVQQAFSLSDAGGVDATTFGSYTVSFGYGYRSGATNHDIRIALWNVTDNVEISGANFTIAVPGSGADNLTNTSVVLNYDNTVGSMIGDSIAVRFISLGSDLENNAWQRTAIIDNVSLTAVPEPSIAFLGGLGLLGLLRRRR